MMFGKCQAPIDENGDEVKYDVFEWLFPLFIPHSKEHLSIHRSHEVSRLLEDTHHKLFNSAELIHTNALLLNQPKVDPSSRNVSKYSKFPSLGFTIETDPNTSVHGPNNSYPFGW